MADEKTQSKKNVIPKKEAIPKGEIVSGEVIHEGVFIPKGQYVVVRAHDAGVHAGILHSVGPDRRVDLKSSRRLWSWHCNKGDFLCGVSLWGLNHDKSKVGAPVSRLTILDACEVLEATEESAKSIASAPVHTP